MLFMPRISLFLFVFFLLNNLFSATVILDDYNGNYSLNKTITDTDAGSITDDWNFRVTDGTTTSQLGTSYWYNEGTSGGEFRLRDDHGAYFRANVGLGEVGTALFASTNLGSNYSFTAASKYSIKLYHSHRNQITMNDDSGVRLAVQVNDTSWYVSNRIYGHTGVNTIHEDSINNLTWYYIDPSNYNASKFNLDDSGLEILYSDLGAITNVGVYMYANIESTNNPPGGFNWGVREFNVSDLELVPIPEPSTYALILGCFSIIFVIYIRRKN